MLSSTHPAYSLDQGGRACELSVVSIACAGEKPRLGPNSLFFFASSAAEAMNHHPPSAKRKRGSLREQPKGSSGLETVQRKDALLFTRSPIEFGTFGKHLYNPSSIEFGIGLGVNVLASDTDDGLRLDEDLDELISTFVMIESGPGEGKVEIAVSSKEINIPIESQSPSLKKKTQTKQRTRKKGTKSKQQPSQEKSSEKVQTKKMRMAFVIEEEPPR